MVIFMGMETQLVPEDKQKKKPGPVKKPYPMVDTHIFVPPHLLEWAKVQPEGFAGLVRALLREEYRLRMGLVT